MVNTIILIESKTDLEYSRIDQSQSDGSKFITFGINAHKTLERKGLTHEIADNYLNNDDRLKIFDSTVSYFEWYNKCNQITKALELEGINLLTLLDTGELHRLLIEEIRKFLILKRIIEKENPTKIILPESFSKSIKSFSSERGILIDIIPSNVKDHMLWDEVQIKFDFAKIPFSFKISKSTYNKIKNLYDTLLTSIWNLDFDLKDRKKTILLLEFEPTAYSELLFSLKKSDTNVVLLNRRRSAIWSLGAVRVLRNSGCKILNLDKLITNETLDYASRLVEKYSKELNKLWSNEMFEKFFSIEDHTFWPSIKDQLISSYANRIQEYVHLALASKILFEKVNLSCILCLNIFGETEKTIVETNKSKLPLIMLEHGYANYIPETTRYDALGMYPFLHDKIAVWGNTQKQHLIEHHNFNSDRIFVTGSPRHDSFFRAKISQKKDGEKIILLTIHPIDTVTAAPETNLKLRFENFIKNFLIIIKKMNGVKLVVKLHPGQVYYNMEIIKLFKELDKRIPIYLVKPIKELLQDCDVVINISPEGFDPSTVMLEAIIVKKPVMDIVLDNKIYNFQYEKDKAILSVPDSNDLENKIHDILFNEKSRNMLINNGQIHLNNYLTNHGNASEYLAKIVNSF